MFIQQWAEIFSVSLQGLWIKFIDFVPDLLLAIIFFIIGWVVATVVAKALSQVIGALKVDKLLETIGLDKVLDRAGLKLSTGNFIGEIVKWFIIVLFLVTSLEILGLSQVNDFLINVVLGYLPQVIIAAFILIIATVIADFMGGFVESSFKAMDVKSAKMAGSVAKYAIWVFAIIIVLSELGIAPAFMQILFTGIVAMLAIAGGLAFGLGGKDAAARTVGHISDSLSHRQ